jgi:peptidoglycan/LPS O-acetylase OafA/YrhL
MSQPPPDAPTHVRALDHVRAIAAFSVVIHHIEQAKALLGLPGIWAAPWIQSLGGGGVDVFFGLSGYVITQSLLRERARAAGALLGRFYVRRGLRILPLYFALVVVAFGPLPWLMVGVDSQVGGVLEPALRARDEHYGALLALHLLGLPNAALVAYPGVPFATHLWSVGAEMQFYLAWPLFFLLTRNVWTSALVATLATLAVDAVLRGAVGGVAPLPAWTGVVRQTLDTLHPRYLLAGICAAAVVASRGGRPGPRGLSGVLHWGAFAIVLGLLTGRHLLPFTNWVSPALLAAALTALALAQYQPRPGTSVADHLGRISYSVYVWHVLVIGLIALLVDVTLGLQPWGDGPHLALYGGVIAGTIVAATASYHVIEQPFLRLAARRR